MGAFEEHILPGIRNLQQHIPPSVTVQAASYLSSANGHFQTLRDTYAEPYLLTPMSSLLNSPPDLFSIFLLALIFIISLKILDYARRVITFWVVLVFRLAFWGALLGGAWYVYTVGLERAAENAAWVLGLLEGFIREMVAANANGGRDGGASSKGSGSWSRGSGRSQWT